MKTFKQHQAYLAEAKPSGAEYESIITVGYNQGSPPYSLKRAKDATAYQTVSKFFPKHNQEAEQLGNTFHKAGISGVMHQHGASKDSTSSLWKKTTGKGKDTPKTDMYAGKYNISLKKKGGSQLMSGKGPESIATIIGALEMAGENRPAIQKITNDIDNNFTRFLIDGSKTAFKNKEGEFAKMKPREYKAKSDELLDIDKMHNKLSNKINNALQKDNTIKENICYIATTGYKKFPEGSRGIANKLIEFDPKTGAITHNIDPGSPNNISSSMKNMAAATSFYCAFKTSKKNPYSTLRTKTGKFEEHNPTLNGLIIETLMKDLNLDTQTLLNEGYALLTEAGIISSLISKGISTLKKIGRSVRDWFSNIISKIAEGAKKVFQQIVSLGKRAFQALFNFLGVILTNGSVRVSGLAGAFAAK